MSTLIEVKNASVVYKTRGAFFNNKKFKALDDISLSVNKGENLGILGGNGSGKSTLLRLLSGIYQPDYGVVKYNNCRVSLLSLSVGFDPELTGRENAIMSSLLLGFDYSQVQEKLDKILSYAEIGSFIDQPTKTYSSGMRARLGFSVAVTMKPDVLLIDEVLGVGDASFKEKAESTMRQKLNSDQTVVLVSHSMGQIKRICNRAILLDSGTIRAEGDVDKVAEIYSEVLKSRKIG